MSNTDAKKNDVTALDATTLDISTLDATTLRYWRAFEALERRHQVPTWLQEERERSLATFAQQGFPTRRDEEWRSTSLKRITDANFVPLASSISPTFADLPDLSLSEAICIRTSNGRVEPLDDVDAPAGVQLRSFASLVKSEPDVARSLLTCGTPSSLSALNLPMAALNMAFFDDAVVVEIAANATVDTVIHIVHTVGRQDSDDTPLETSPRVFIRLAENAKARVLESWHHCGAAPTFSNAVGAIDLAAGAHLEHTIVHDASSSANLVLTTNAKLGAQSSYTERGFWLSGGIIRHDLQTFLVEEGATCSLDGLALTHGDSLVDGHYAVFHEVGGCTSAQRFRTVLDDRSTAVFNGKVVMRAGADKSDATQENRNLLLSRDTEVYAKPQLEIFADDVKASHGSTVGQLDTEALFYLRTRGIGLDDATRMLVSAFAKSLVDDIQIEELATQVRALVDARLVLAATERPAADEKGSA